MESLKFEKRHIDLDVYGEKAKVFYPTPRQVNSYLAGLKLIVDGESDKTDMDLVLELLEKLGLKRELSENMDIQQISELSNMLLEQKKS